MNHSEESQKKALGYLVDNCPHDMKKFVKLFESVKDSDVKVTINLEDILFSEVWTFEEKVKLIKLYGYAEEKAKVYLSSIFGSYKGIGWIDACIMNNSFSGIQALLELNVPITLNTFNYIISSIKDVDERYKYFELIVNHYKGKEPIIFYQFKDGYRSTRELPSLVERYPESASCSTEFWRLTNPMKSICNTNDLELIRLFLPLVKNVKPLLQFAVENGNIEMAKMFIEAGADVNYQELEYEADCGRRLFKTPIKIAIDNNDFEMVKFLHENGADLNFVDNSERMQEFVSHLGKEEEKESHEYSFYWDRQDYIIWTKTPLEYAINLGAASIIDQDLVNNDSKRVDDSIAKQFADRMDIVRYLYENDATFTDGSVNYTDLICYAIKSDDFEATKYFFEEALKKKATVDFAKIIDFIHYPGIVKDNMIRVTYKEFEDADRPWFWLCKEYSKKIDEENHIHNMELMLRKIFGSNRLRYNYAEYKDLVFNLSKELPKENLVTIPAIFGVGSENFNDIISLGYDINCVDAIGDNLLLDYIHRGGSDKAYIDKLISLGYDINAVNPKNGENALSYAILQGVHKYEYGDFLDLFDVDKQEVKPHFAGTINSGIDIIKYIIGLSNTENITSSVVKNRVYDRIKPGYQQVIYKDVLLGLAQKGFTVDDDYFNKSLSKISDCFLIGKINMWMFLENLYSIFNNYAIRANTWFPNVDKFKEIPYGTVENGRLFILIAEHLFRNFVTSKDQLEDPDRLMNFALTVLMEAQNRLLYEINRYIGVLNYHQIVALIDNCSIIDVDALTRNGLLSSALEVEDLDLARELIKRGDTITRYDSNGCDVTEKYFSKREIELFQSINVDYNPNKEAEDLLAQIGCEGVALSLKL